VFLLTWAWSPLVLAVPPSTPITVELQLSHAPKLHEEAMVSVEVRSYLDAPGTSVELVLPEGATAKATKWVVDLQANVPVTIGTSVAFHQPGNLTLAVRARRALSPDVIWGDMKAIPLFIGGPAGRVAEMAWRVDKVPVAALAAQGDTRILSLEPTPFSFVPPAVNIPELEPSEAPALRKRCH
jgi:hypothetical protein